MKRTFIVLSSLLLTAVLLTVGCTELKDDEQAIIDLLNGSQYTDENHTRGYSSEDSTVTEGGNGPGPLSDGGQRIPFVRFRRYVPPGGVSRRIEVTIPAYPGYPDTTALATITSDINGELRTMFDTTGNPIYVWRKPFEDRAVRKVYLTRHENHWRIRRVSPLRFATVGAPYELGIAELKIHATSWPVRDTLRIASGDTMLTREELPAFVPADTVEVWVEAESSGDSCWTFLHHGQPNWRYRHRHAYLKGSTFQFHGAWLIGDEEYDQPQVRPSGHDVIGWNSLWSDTSAPYVSAAWGIPYIVRNPGEEIPEE